MQDKEIRLWRWRYTNEFGKRVESSWRMTEDDAAGYRDAEKIEWTLEVRSVTPTSTSDFLRSKPTS